MINSYDDWLKWTEDFSWWKYSNHKFPLYRGHKRETFILKPYITRFFNDSAILKLKERAILDLFYNKLKERNKLNLITEQFLPARFHNDWLKLFQAQHLGLPTRLMDWTPDPDIALFFATEKNATEIEDDDTFYGCIWIYPCDSGELIGYDNEIALQMESPFDLKETKIINPSFTFSRDFKDKLPEQRRLYQGGRFIIQPYDVCMKSLEYQTNFQKKLQRIVINKAAKKEIKLKLNDKNINKDTLYRQNDLEIKEIIEEILITLK